MPSKIPQSVAKQYLREQRTIIQNRIQFFGWIFVLAFVGTTFVAHVFILETYPPQLIPTWSITLLASVILTAIMRHQYRVGFTKFLAFIWITFLLIIIAYYHYSIKLPAAQAVLLYLFTLFGISLTIPWKPGEVVAILAIHGLGYGVSFLWLQPDIFPLFSLHENIAKQIVKGFDIVKESPQYADFLYGNVILCCAAIICYLARKGEYRQGLENFLLVRDIASATAQIQKDLALATRVHTRLVPQSEDTAQVNISVQYLPAQYISGDYARYHKLSDTELLFIIVDVTGHGIPAALMVNTLHTEFTRLCQEVKEPGILLKYFEQFVIKDFCDTGLYLTAFCGRFNYSTMTLSYSNYGHPEQYVFSADHSRINTLKSQASILGVPLKDSTIYQQELALKHGDHIFLYTDGLIETKNTQNEEYGKKRLEHFIQKHRHLSPDQFDQRLMQEARAFNNNQFHDDVLIMHLLLK